MLQTVDFPAIPLQTALQKVVRECEHLGTPCLTVGVTLRTWTKDCRDEAGDRAMRYYFRLQRSESIGHRAANEQFRIVIEKTCQSTMHWSARLDGYENSMCISRRNHFNYILSSLRGNGQAASLTVTRSGQQRWRHSFCFFYSQETKPYIRLARSNVTHNFKALRLLLFISVI